MRDRLTWRSLHAAPFGGIIVLLQNVQLKEAYELYIVLDDPVMTYTVTYWDWDSSDRWGDCTFKLRLPWQPVYARDSRA